MSNYFERAHALFALKRYDAAIEAYYQHLAIEPDCFLSRANIAAALIKLKQTTEAAAMLGETLALAPDFAFAHYLRSFTEKNPASDSPALAAIREAIRLEQRADYFLRLGSLLLANNLASDALEAFNQAIAYEPRLARAFLCKAEVLQRLGRDEDAHVALKQALALAPENPDIRVALGKATLNAGLAAEAIDHLHEARRISPVEHNDQLTMAEAYGRDTSLIRPLNAVQKAYLQASPLLQWAINASVATGVILLLRFMPRDSHQEREAVFLVLAIGLNLLFALVFFDNYATLFGIFKKRRDLDLSWSDVAGTTAVTCFALLTIHALPTATAFAFAKAPVFALIALTAILGSLLFAEVPPERKALERMAHLLLIASLIGLGGYALLVAFDDRPLSLLSWFGIVALTGVGTSLMK